MICRHCQQPIRRCPIPKGWQCGGKGWIHSRDGEHACHGSAPGLHIYAEPEPGTLPTTEAPTSKPSREVA